MLSLPLMVIVVSLTSRRIAVACSIVAASTTTVVVVVVGVVVVGRRYKCVTSPSLLPSTLSFHSFSTKVALFYLI
jgi:hypothetical protein